MDQDPIVPQDRQEKNSNPPTPIKPEAPVASTPIAPEVATSPAAPPQKPQTPGGEINLEKILLPQKQVHAPEHAQRINAGALLDQEVHATLRPEIPPEVKKNPSVVSPEEIEAAVKKKKEAPAIRPLQTYKGDIEQLVENKNVSVVSIAAAEAGRREAQAIGSTAAQPARDWSPLVRLSMIILGVFLLVGTIGIGAYLYVAPRLGVSITPPLASPFISVDQTTFVPLPDGQISRNDLVKRTVETKNGLYLSLGLIARLYPGVSIDTETTQEIPRLMSAQQFLSTLAPNMPNELLRTIDPAQYLLGAHAFDEKQAFLILRVDDYGQAFSGMLGWERTMYNELTPLFTRTISPRIQNSAPQMTVETISTSTSDSAFIPRFVDRIVENHDARVIQNEYGDILLLWTFLDPNTLVITNNEYTLKEIISRRNDINIVPKI